MFCQIRETHFFSAVNTWLRIFHIFWVLCIASFSNRPNVMINHNHKPCLVISPGFVIETSSCENYSEFVHLNKDRCLLSLWNSFIDIEFTMDVKPNPPETIEWRLIIISRYLHMKVCYVMLLDKISYKWSVYGGFNEWDYPVIAKNLQWLLQWEFAPVD